MFSEYVDAMLFAACDAMGAVSGYHWLKARGLPVAGFSGMLTCSPLQCQESARETGLPVWSRTELARPKNALHILTSARSADLGGHDACSGRD